MKIGLIARADNTGLGNQTWEFYKHMSPYRTMVVDISRLNGNKQHYERYPDIHTTTFIQGFPTPHDIDLFLTELDVVFVAESAYNPYLYTRARELGVKVAVQYNYEFFDWFTNPDQPKPDMFIAPSGWHYEKVDEFCRNNGIMHVYLHCPVNRELIPFREIKHARTFLHMAGKPAAHDRNGTKVVIAASKYLQTEALIYVHFQGEQGLGHQTTDTYADYLSYADANADLAKLSITKNEYDNYEDIYKSADVMVLPRRYGGNCLPANEALSAGMPVIMPDISPNNQLLPPEWLLPARKISEFTPRTTVDIYDVDPRNLAAKIDEFYTMSELDMSLQNHKANELAQSISWDVLKDRYHKAFGELCAR